MRRLTCQKQVSQNIQEGNNMNASATLKKLGIEQMFNYIYKDPNKNLPNSWTGQISSLKSNLNPREK